MLIEEQDQQSRFFCKLCNKRFPSGKAFGGHMRSHVAANSGESDERFEAKRKLFSVTEEEMEEEEEDQLMRDSWEFAEFGEGQNGGYGLRENPRKTWRATDSIGATSSISRICKRCGKGFQSLKALCGHMACHSDKERVLKDDSSWTSENHKLIMDDFSDTESDRRKLISSTRRSSGSKKRVKSVEDSQFSSIFEIDGHEQFEVARCLMLLSKDQMNRGNVYSIVESSDNNSVVLETKSSSTDMKISKGKNLGSIDNCKIKKIAMEDDSDSGYFLDENVDTESELDYRAQVRNKTFKRFESRMNVSTAKTVNRGEEHSEKNLPKRSKYECMNCKKVFKSYQALGGHRPCHRRIENNPNHESRYESGENSLEDDQTYRSSEPVSHSKESSSQKKTNPKKNKLHVCPFCDRVFKNGQALGGHKRSHFINANVETKNNRATLIRKHDQLDLNLPAPEASEDAVNGQFF